ncbi:hypothetical protein [Actinomadura rugatobispora]|uniref:Uncharacterized protein n=1 Tax=Actinomadura rugatobispora TaxID=1994 RepID=A0ABW0ZZR3_9ACTN|nr:hypothetical protein GCM10010200_091700 [Actinomadura rugatobispora]
MARRSVFDDMIVRGEKLGKANSRALRKSLRVKKKKGGKKRAKRNERHIRELAGQVAALSHQISELRK